MLAVAVAAVAAGVLVMAPTVVGARVGVPLASADTCPPIEVVFARGTGEPPGIGSVGQAFVDSLRTQVGGHVAAVAVFGNPSAKVGAPLTLSPLYGPKSIDLCTAGDPVCSNGNDAAAHRGYGPAGLTNQAAGFAAGLL